MIASEELLIILMSVYLLGVLWLALDAAFGKSKGAARLRAKGATTGKLIWMAIGWPALMVDPYLKVAILSIMGTMHVIRAVLVVVWKEMSDKER